MRKISLLGLIAASLVHFQAAAQTVEIVCYYQVVGEGNLLSAQDMIDLKFKHYMPVVAWIGGKKKATLFGYGPDKYSEFTYTIQQVGVGQIDDVKINSEFMLNEIKKDFDSYGVVNPKVSFMGCKTTPLEH